MIKTATILAASTVLALAVTPARAAGVTKTWVSSTTGNDTGTCQFTSPCKTFAFAITQTLAGGEIDVKDGGSYGPVTITQAVSIVSEGALAQISVPANGIGVTVAAGSSDTVTLQGLVIDGHGVGQDGIDFNSGSNLKIENCHIRKLTATGLNVTGSTQFLHVEDTEFANVTGNAIFIGANNKINGTITRSFVTDNGNGVAVNNANLLVIESTLSGNSADGLSTGNGANVLIGQSTISGNMVYGIFVTNGIVGSYGDNYINANAIDINGTLSSVARR